MTSRFDLVTLDSPDPDRIADFWRSALGLGSLGLAGILGDDGLRAASAARLPDGRLLDEAAGAGFAVFAGIVSGSEAMAPIGT